MHESLKGFAMICFTHVPYFHLLKCKYCPYWSDLTLHFSLRYPFEETSLVGSR